MRRSKRLNKIVRVNYSYDDTSDDMSDVDADTKGDSDDSWVEHNSDHSDVSQVEDDQELDDIDMSAVDELISDAKVFLGARKKTVKVQRHYYINKAEFIFHHLSTIMSERSDDGRLSIQDACINSTSYEPYVIMNFRTSENNAIIRTRLSFDESSIGVTFENYIHNEVPEIPNTHSFLRNSISSTVLTNNKEYSFENFEKLSDFLISQPDNTH
jgi:hypothetical protein